MRHHFGDVVEEMDAVMRGNLSQARASARAILESPDPGGMPAAAASHLQALRAQADRAAKAPDLATAASATAAMLATCGDCHRAVGTMPAQARPAEPKIGGVIGHMEEHNVATNLLAEALTTPSDSLWMDGAEALSVAPLKRTDLPDTAKITRDMMKNEQAVHALATRARMATNTPARVAVYSELITSCTACHAANNRSGPTP